MKSVILTLRFLWLETQKAFLEQKTLFVGILLLIFLDSFKILSLFSTIWLFLIAIMSLSVWTGYHYRIYRPANFPNVFQLPIDNLQRFIVYLVLPVTVSLGLLLLIIAILGIGDGYRFFWGGREYSSQINEKLGWLSDFSSADWPDIFCVCFLYHFLFGATGVVVLYFRRFYLLGLLGLLILPQVIGEFVGRMSPFYLTVIDSWDFWLVLDLVVWTLYFFGLKRTKVY